LVDDKYFVFTGYLLMTDEDVLGFAEAYFNQIVNDGDFQRTSRVRSVTLIRMMALFDCVKV